MSGATEWIAELTGYRDALEAAGERSTIDAGAIAPPCTLIAIREIDFVGTLGCDGDTTVIAVVIGAPGDPSGITDAGLLHRVELVAGVLDVTRATRTTFTLPGADPLPAYQLS